MTTGGRMTTLYDDGRRSPLAPVGMPQLGKDPAAGVPKRPRGRVFGRRAGPDVYERLRQIAGRVHDDERALTVSPTELVHEALLRLPAEVREDPDANFGLVRREMDRVAIDRARARLAGRRWGSDVRETMGAADVLGDPDQEARQIQSLDLRRALDRLAQICPRLRELVRLRYELGLSQEKTAAVLGLTDRTVRRDWAKARGLLEALLTDEAGQGGPSGVPLD